MQYEKFMLKRGAFSEVRLQAQCSSELSRAHNPAFLTCVKR
jgi:hypothetical protein